VGVHVGLEAVVSFALEQCHVELPTDERAVSIRPRAHLLLAGWIRLQCRYGISAEALSGEVLLELLWGYQRNTRVLLGDPD